MPSPLALLFIGTVVSPTEEHSIEIYHNSLLAVNADGFITHFEDSKTEASKALLEQAEGDFAVTLHRVGAREGDHGFILPGFVDTHIHAPQYLNAGTALDKPLMEWLEHYTFKSEARIDADPNGLGARVYKKLVGRMIEAGTTLASVFGTLTVDANLVLAKAFQDGGIRGQIGKVAMDLNGIDSYIESTSVSLARMSSYLAAFDTLLSPLPRHRRLIEPVITPRFVPTCSKELLVGLATLAAETGARIQSHLSEAIDQVEWSKSMWGGEPDYAVFDSLNLLTPRTLMAHCTHLPPAGLSLLASRQTSIAHCPLSNIYFSPEQHFPLREAQTFGIAIGLGSDISGGFRLGIDEAMRWGVAVSRLREGARDGVTPKDPPETLAVSWKESVYLATLGGATALGREGTCGSFAVGKAFDAQLVRLGRGGSRVDLFEEEEGGEREGEGRFEDALERWWCNGAEADRVGVWVQGVCLRMLAG